MLTTRSTFAPWRSRLPGLGRCAITWPFLTVRDGLCVTLPSEQSWDLIARVAAATVLPFTFGTTHRCGFAANVAVTVVSASVVTRHAPVPEQPPPSQPVNVEPGSGVAVSVTLVPWA